MKWISRLIRGWQSDLGLILAILIAALSILSILYLFIANRKKKRDFLFFCYPNYYTEVSSFLKKRESTSIGSFRTTPFGREWKTKEKDGFYYYWSPPSPIAKEQHREHFQQFCDTLACSPIALFPKYHYVHTDQVWICASKDLIQKRGNILITLHDYVLDSTLSHDDAQSLLIDIAKGLSSLHQLSTDSGQFLYHGWILPTNIYLDLDEAGHIKTTLLSFPGFIFSLKREKTAELIQQIEKKKRAWMPSRTIKTFAPFLPHFAPEQKKMESNFHSGQSIDFFQFGALAVWLFTKNPFCNALDWNLIPTHWHTFLQSCLSEDPSKRPQDLLDVLDYLYDPEWKSLEQQFSETMNTIENQPKNYVALKEVANNIKAIFSSSPASSQTDLDELLMRGEQALIQRQWTKAKNFFEQAEQKTESVEIQLKLAIAHYKLGNRKESKAYYDKIKQHSPKLCQEFHQRIAFRM